MLEPPDKGEVYLSGQNLMESKTNINALRAKIGMVFQHFNLFSHLKAIDNVSIGLRRVKKLPKEEAREGGQQQRVGIARALVMEPDVILFDEPTSALDPELIGEVLQVMLDLAKAGTTMVVVTHELGFARAVSSEMLYLDEGVIVERGTPEHFFTSPKSERVRRFLNQISILYGSHEKLLELSKKEKNE